MQSDDLNSALSEINIQKEVDLSLADIEPTVMQEKQTAKSGILNNEIELITSDPLELNLHVIDEQYQINVELPEPPVATLTEKQVSVAEPIMQNPKLIQIAEEIPALHHLDINYEINLDLSDNAESTTLHLEPTLFVSEPAKITLEQQASTSIKDLALLNGLLNAAQELADCLKQLNNTLDNTNNYKPDTNP